MPAPADVAVPLARRHVGLETEHAVQVLRPDADPDLGDRLAIDAMRVGFPAVHYTGHQDNGCRSYLDVGSHPEHATYETTDPDECVAVDQHGSARLARRVADAAERHGTRDVTLLRGNVDASGATWGCHENYQIAAALGTRAAADLLASHLISRTRWAGAGTVVHHRPRHDRPTPHSARRDPLPPDPSATFELSARAAHLLLPGTGGRPVPVAADHTVRSRPLVSLRDEHHADPSRYRRLHVICGDTNVGTEPAVVKLASTMLLLTVAEADPDLLGRYQVANPARALHVVARDVPGRALLRLADGRRFTATCLQQALWETAASTLHRYGLATGTTDRHLDRWAALISVTSPQDPDHLADGPATRQVDWVAKYRLMCRWMDRHGHSWSASRLRLLDIDYHQVGTGTGYRLAAVAQGPAVAAVSDGPMMPRTGRAAARARIVAALTERGLPATVDWSRVLVPVGNGDVVRFEMPDPAGPPPGATGSFIDQVDQARR